MLLGVNSNTPLELLKLVRLVRIRRLTDNAKVLFGGKILKVVATG